MKLVCVNLKRVEWTKYPEKFITLSKLYDLIKSDEYNYLIKDDRGKFMSYSKSLFITLPEWRQKQLNKIGI